MMCRMFARLACAAMLILMNGRSVHAQSCSAAASAIRFGTVSPIKLNAIDSTGTVAVTCRWPARTTTPNALVCLNLNAASPRALANGRHSMRYDLYQNAAHSLVWGSAFKGTAPIALTLTRPATGTRATQTVTVYGQIAGNQPTVPTIGNRRTVYAQHLAGAATALSYGFFAASPPNCTSLASSRRFSVNVAATVVADCTISATNLVFGATSATNKALTATGAISARCTKGDAWRIALSGGKSGNPAARKMQRAAGGGAVDYQLYTNAAHSKIWGDGTNGTSMETGLGTGNVTTIRVYGHVPAQATPAPGNYSDAVTAMISF